MYSSSHGIPRAASSHGTTSSVLPGGLKDSDTLASQSCGLDSKNFLVSFIRSISSVISAAENSWSLISNL